jgi:hypothetical protein
MADRTRSRSGPPVPRPLESLRPVRRAVPDPVRRMPRPEDERFVTDWWEPEPVVRIRPV